MVSRGGLLRKIRNLGLVSRKETIAYRSSEAVASSLSPNPYPPIPNPHYRRLKSSRSAGRGSNGQEVLVSADGRAGPPHRFYDLAIDQGRELLRVVAAGRASGERIARRGVQVDFIEAVGKMPEEPGEALCGHLPRPSDPERGGRNLQADATGTRTAFAPSWAACLMKSAATTGWTWKCRWALM